MNTYQTDMFNELTTLVETSDSFFAKDFVLNGTTFRIFNYRLASYTDFMLPSALEARGVMFELTPNGDVANLVSLPFAKFFNAGENPSTMDLDFSTVVSIADKADGSMISTFMHPTGIMLLKTKGSIESEQCVDAMSWLDRNRKFRSELAHAYLLGHTVIMEWVAPWNRIVLSYEKERLIVLGVRNMSNGTHMIYDDIDPDRFSEILKHWTGSVDIDETSTTKAEFVDSIPDMEDDIEGYVILLESGLRVKVKTKHYLHLHKNKDNVNSPKKLYAAVVYETSDDLRSLFIDDQTVLDIIQEMEDHVSVKYNHVVAMSEAFHDTNKELTRKDYAILGQKELPKNIFGLVMSLYLGKEIDYKAFMVKQYDSFKMEGAVEPEDRVK